MIKRLLFGACVVKLKRKVLGFGAIWAAITLIFLLMLLMLDISRHRETLQLESSVIYEYAYERALINEVLLNNFVELVENDTADEQAIRRYARDMREHYPHIAYFLLYSRVSGDQVSSFEAARQADGYPEFQLRTQESGLKHQPFYYPVTFVEPMNEDTSPFLGLDGYSHPAKRVAILQASYYLDVFASEAYPLESGEMGYRLFHSVDPTVAGEDEEGHLIASLVIQADELLPPLPHIKGGLKLILEDGKGVVLVKRPATREPGWLSSRLLPVISDTRSISRFGQSLDVTVEKQLLWSEVNWPIGVVVLAFSVFAFVLTAQNYLRKKEAQAELENLNEKLVYERDLLEERVQERTWELVKANSELRKQVRDNRNLTQKVLSIQEEERRNIARELHDEMGQSLTAIRADAHILKGATGADPLSIEYQAATSIDGVAERIYSVTYGLMRSLRPAALDDLGLADALNECVANSHLDAVGIQLHQAMQGPLNEMSEDLNISCYRLLQEALNNCVKHSGCDTIWLTVRRDEQQDDLLYISVRDNGLGFDPLALNGGFGLIGMRERVYALGGNFQVTSAPGEGTHVEATIPVA